jgi:hypothetical protein
MIAYAPQRTSSMTESPSSPKSLKETERNASDRADY